jgi:hypothetical protein
MRYRKRNYVKGLAIACAVHLLLIFCPGLPSIHPLPKNSSPTARSVKIHLVESPTPSPAPEVEKPLTSRKIAPRKKSSAGPNTDAKSSNGTNTVVHAELPTSISYSKLLPRPEFPIQEGTGTVIAQTLEKELNRYGTLSTTEKLTIGTIKGRLDLPLSVRTTIRPGVASADLSLDQPTGEWRIKRMSGDPYLRAALFETLVDKDNYLLLKQFLASDRLAEYCITLSFTKEYRFKTTKPPSTISLTGNHLTFHEVALDRQYTVYETSDSALEREREEERLEHQFLPTRVQMSFRGGATIPFCDRHCQLAKDRDQMAKKKLSESPAFQVSIQNRLISDEIARRRKWSGEMAR